MVRISCLIRVNDILLICRQFSRSSLNHVVQLQVTPLTPSTKGFVLKTSYASWDKDSERLGVSKDPRLWTKEHVTHWLSWAIREFSLAEPNYSQFVQQFQVGFFIKRITLLTIFVIYEDRLNDE